MLWHLGAITFLFRWIFRDPKVDMRFLAMGVVAPDLVDLAVATVFGSPRAELWGHSLLAPTALAVAVLLSTRRGRRRRGWMALVVAWLFHLLLDGMWADARVFLWPAFGFGLDVAGSGFWAEAWMRAIGDPWRWVLELVGLTYLIWLWKASELDEPDARRELRVSGRLRYHPTTS